MGKAVDQIVSLGFPVTGNPDIHKHDLVDPVRSFHERIHLSQGHRRIRPERDDQDIGSPVSEDLGEFRISMGEGAPEVRADTDPRNSGLKVSGCLPCDRIPDHRKRGCARLGRLDPVGGEDQHHRSDDEADEERGFAFHGGHRDILRVGAPSVASSLL